MIKLFLQYLKTERNVSPSTLRAYASDLKLFGTCLETAVRDDIKSFITRQNCKVTTINRRIACLKSFYKWAVANGHLDHDPTKGIRMLKEPKLLPRIITADQLKALFAHLEAYNYPSQYRKDLTIVIFWTMLGTGIRISELQTLRATDFDFTANTLKVYGKGAKERIIILPSPLVCPLVKLLRAFIQKYSLAKFLFPSPVTANPLDITRIRNIINIHLRMVKGLEHATPHWLRHTYITRIVETGNLMVACEQAGHESVATTQRYTHLATDQKRKVVNQVFERRFI